MTPKLNQDSYGYIEVNYLEHQNINLNTTQSTKKQSK